jgi:hypothetical protein
MGYEVFGAVEKDSIYCYIGRIGVPDGIRTRVIAVKVAERLVTY